MESKSTVVKASSFPSTPLSGRALPVASALLLCLSAACTGGSKDSAGVGSVLDGGTYTLTVLGPAKAGSCELHAETAPTFTESNAQWGMTGAGFGGGTVADLDNDGYPDLVISIGGARETIPASSGGFQNGGVFMNRPNPAGGRMFVDSTAASGLFQVRGGSTTQYREADFVALADVNNDGNLDAFTTVSFSDANFPMPPSPLPADQNEILLNDGHGHFTLAPQSGPSQIVQPEAFQNVFTDVDNDGNLDLFMTFWSVDGAAGPMGSQAQLLKGGGDGTFTTITPAGMMTDDADVEITNQGIPQTTIDNILDGTNPRPSFGAVACDLNGDGYPELLLSSYGGESNMLYLNDGTGNFSRQLNGNGGFDGDANVDYHDNQYYLCYCTYPENHATSYCAGAAKPTVGCPPDGQDPWYPGFSDAPAELNGNNFSAACRDMNGDGIPDVFQGTIRHWWAGNTTDPSTLMINHTPQSAQGGAVAFTRLDGSADGVTFPHLDPQGWNEGVQQNTLVDLDNDGYPDILAGESGYAYQFGRLFQQQSDGTFVDKAMQWGLTFPCMDIIAVADFDRDGDLDILARGDQYRQCGACAAGTSPSASNQCGGWSAVTGGPAFPKGYAIPEAHLYTNNASESAHWLEIRLRGNKTTTNATAIGARVTVTVSGVAQVQDILAGHGIGSESDDPGVLFYGLGACSAVDKIQVRWPNKSLSVDTWQNVPANHLLELHEGDAKVYGVNLAANSG